MLAFRVGVNVQLPENPRAVVGHNQAPPDFDFINSRMVLWGAEFLQFSYGHLDDLFVSGKARANKRKMWFRRVLSYCLSELVGQEAQARVMDRHRDTIGDDQAAVREWCEKDDDFAERVEKIRLGMDAYIHIKTDQDWFEGRLAHWGGAHPRLKRKAEARDLLTIAAKKLSREGLGVLGRVVLAEQTKKRLRQDAFREIESGLKECFAEGFITDAEPSEPRGVPRKPDAQRQVAPTKQGALVYLEAVSLGLVSKPKRRE